MRRSLILSILFEACIAGLLFIFLVKFTPLFDRVLPWRHDDIVNTAGQTTKHPEKKLETGDSIYYQTPPAPVSFMIHRKNKTNNPDTMWVSSSLWKVQTQSTQSAQWAQWVATMTNNNHHRYSIPQSILGLVQHISVREQNPNEISTNTNWNKSVADTNSNNTSQANNISTENPFFSALSAQLGQSLARIKSTEIYRKPTARLVSYLPLTIKDVHPKVMNNVKNNNESN